MRLLCNPSLMHSFIPFPLNYTSTYSIDPINNVNEMCSLLFLPFHDHWIIRRIHV